MVKGASPNCSHNPVVAIVQEQLGKLVTDLREIEKKCSRESNDGKSPKAKRRRWILEGNKIRRLREKASSAKQNLGVVLGLDQRDAMNHIREEYVSGGMAVADD
jgi:hypothetical protein